MIKTDIPGPILSGRKFNQKVQKMDIRDRFHDSCNFSKLVGSTFKLSCLHEISYEVIFIKRILDPANKMLADYIVNSSAFCIIDQNVRELYNDQILNYFDHFSINAHYYYIESTEHKKRFEAVIDFANFCFKNGLNRKDYVICFGGGITCDIGSLAANLMRRSTPCIKIPTTLTAIVDAAVGVKTGVNFAGMKNSLGSYFPPVVVFTDIGFLKSLPKRQIRNGLVEIVKIIALKDTQLWNLLNNNIENFYRYPYNDAVKKIIDYSILYMMDELQSNLFEKDLKRIVDYGHEFGHSIEIITNHELLHGEAVGIGMLISNSIALHQKVMAVEDYYRFIELYRKLKIPFYHENLTLEALVDTLESIKRHKNGNINLVVLEKIGSPVFLNKVSLEDIDYAVQLLLSEG